MMGNASDPSTLTEPDCEFRTRLSHENESDHWWPYGSTVEEAEASVADLVALYRERGASHFAAWADFPGKYIELSPEQLETNNLYYTSFRTTTIRTALAMARIHAHLGNQKTVRAFAEFALANVGRATGLKLDFEELLRDAAGPA